MFTNMRRKEKMISENDTKEILNRCQHGTLATISVNGYPYSVPLNYVFDQNRLYFHSATTGHKLDNIQHNPLVSFTVIDYYQLIPEKFDAHYDSVIVYGKASIVEEVEGKRKALQLFIKKYSPNYVEQGNHYIERAMNHTTVIQMQVEHMTGKHGR
ncbi:hypothetical protein BHU72_08510 [Desulfuribacillus stibiiarsenatis]|uniref:MFS transporter n=1 Tax=Desulfuribacillus stibiiarsenatis TaxID=1390249 RepID=A0A1E5L389_9FIRM|nr:pyridoxamine 5'-phosphate oxidase family protein [Desulfuribacillus stibiiarsenatis]OEH84541.1 hypothetical protein BHU72_08510 [Desulfuribacillus stibiiarsenatis]